MKKNILKIFSAMICVVFLFSIFSIISSACPAPGCNSTVKKAYCGGEYDYGFDTHTIWWTDLTWPFIHNEECTYFYEDHYTYGVCQACGYIYPPGSDVFLNHTVCDHSSTHCDDDYFCSDGDWLSWYF